MSEYNRLREEAHGEAGEAWRRADTEVNRLRDLYTDLKEDPRFTLEHKAGKSWQAYTSARDKIVAGHEQAREILKKQAQSAERFSIPLPKDASHTVKDSNELIAVQNESTRVISKLERLEQGPLPANKKETLKKEYARGLDLGGVEGSALCKAVLRAAESVGVPVDSVVDDFRKDHHREALERAQLASRMVQSIGGRPPEPPFPRPTDVQPQSLRDVLHGGNQRKNYAPPQKREKARPTWLRS